MKNKVRYFFSIDREEAWLNKQLEQGQLLRHIIAGNLVYQFEQVENNEKVFRLDYREFSKEEDYLNYIQFMEDAGWEHIGGNQDLGKHYFLGLKEQNRELFSDAQSKIEREKRIRKGIIATLSTLVVMLYFDFLLFNITDLTVIQNPKKVFYTPGIWDETGLDFISSFLFELPFASMRLFTALVFPISFIIIFALLIHVELSIKNIEKRG